MTDVRLALRAAPRLREVNEAGVLSAADVHVAQRLGRLGGETDGRVLLAAALAVRAVRGGSVCVVLDDVPATALPEDVEDGGVVPDLPWPEPSAWRAAVEASPIVAVGVDGDPWRPLRWVGGRLYLDRYWRDEQLVRAEVDQRVASAVPVDGARLAAALTRVFGDRPGDRQREAAEVAASHRFTVLTGGPGTGKTTTVAQVLAVLQDVAAGSADGPLRVALAAPTGKAAARLQEAVRSSVATFDAGDRDRVGETSASTVHRLLGWKPGSTTRFKHDRTNHLPHDVVVVDETSMVSLPLMARLLEALRPQARLLLVGDPDQLASVEAGAVLGDLVARPGALESSVVRLTQVYRHGPDIGALATAVREGRADDALAVLRVGHDAVSFVEVGEGPPSVVETAALRSDAVATGIAVTEAARAGDAAGALRALERHRLLVAHRRGPYGVAHWAEEVERWVSAAVEAVEAEGEWYRGRPLLVTSNDRDTGLYNGDTGVVVDDGSGGVVAVFGDADRPVLVRPHRLGSVQTVHAMTVHRGQGSQFAGVTVVLPPADSPLLTRELLYTAVTRARDHVRVIGTEAAVRAAVERPVRRASGLRESLPG